MTRQTRQTRKSRLVDLPDVLTPRDLINFLPIGRNGVYEAINGGRIRSIRIGQKLIVTKAALQEFLGGHVE